MLAVVILRDVDERLVAEGERVLTPADAFQIAVELHQVDAFRRMSTRARSAAGVEPPAWETLPAAMQWAYFHRAIEACTMADAQRRRPASAAVLDPAQPGGDL